MQTETPDLQRPGRPGTSAAQVGCARCRRLAPALSWCCAHCGGPLELAGLPRFEPAAIDGACWSLWRYAAMLPVRLALSLGEGMTPLVAAQVLGVGFLAKLEFLMPSGAYKDRGTAVFINALLAHGGGQVVEDSSGNAGASLAAYAAAAGVQAQIYVPAHAAAAKRRQIRHYGAEIVEVAGPRAATAQACLAAARHSIYASHVWNPWFLLGHMTCAWELWEQLGRQAPDAVACPVGQGNLFLGLARGFLALCDAGCITTMPRMYAVQAAACAPLAHAWDHGLALPVPTTEGATVAEGIRTAHPLRGAEILALARATGGAVLRIDEPAILAAHQASAHAGLAIEPTSAVAVAALPHIRAMLGPGAQIVVALTGSGLKSTDADQPVAAGSRQQAGSSG